MRIALVAENAWPLVGGLETIGLRLGQHLQASGDNCRIVTRFTRQRHGLADYFRASEPGRCFDNQGVDTCVIPLRWWERILWLPLFRLIWRPRTFPLAHALHNLVMVPKLRRRLIGCDAVHFLGSGPELLGFAAAAAARRLGVPFLVEPALHPGQWGDSWIDVRLYRQADRVLAHTEAEGQVLERLGIPAERVSVVLHGVDPQEGGDITLGANVWIGAYVTILPGVTIGDAAVIGAGAVVTRPVPAGDTWGGVPARPLHPQQSPQY